jgi:hypothetical protein
MDLKASDLRYSRHQLREIEVQSISIISYIEEEIRKSFEDGQQYTEVDIPYIFNIDGMKEGESRDFIHWLILEELTSAKKGFNVKYIKSINKYALLINWHSEDDQLIKKHRDNILSYYSTNFEDRSKKQKPQSLSIDYRMQQLRNSIS